MILLNFSHPLTSEQIEKIKSLTNQSQLRVIGIPIQLDNYQPFEPQIRALIDELPLSWQELQSEPILVNPPSYNFAALILFAELHGRIGYFPPIVRIRPVKGSTIQQYEIAEIINLQQIRETARAERRI